MKFLHFLSFSSALLDYQLRLLIASLRFVDFLRYLTDVPSEPCLTPPHTVRGLPSNV